MKHVVKESLSSGVPAVAARVERVSIGTLLFDCFQEGFGEDNGLAGRLEAAPRAGSGARPAIYHAKPQRSPPIALVNKFAVPHLQDAIRRRAEMLPRFRTDDCPFQVQSATFSTCSFLTQA